MLFFRVWDVSCRCRCVVFTSFMYVFVCFGMLLLFFKGLALLLGVMFDV